MGQYEIPRKTKSETKLFLFFSVKGLIGTIIGAVAGTGIGLILRLFMLPFYVIGISALIGAILGFVSVTLPIKKITKIPITAEVDGLYIYEIFTRYTKFKVRRSQKVLYEGEINE